MENMSRRAVALLLAAVFAFGICGMASAERKVYNARGDATVGDVGEVDIAKGREKAVLNATTDASLQAGVFVADYAKVKNGFLTEDAAEIVASKAIKVEEKNFADVEAVQKGNSISYYILVDIVATVDTSDVEKAMAQYIKAQSDLTEEEKSQQKAARADVKKMREANVAAAKANPKDVATSQRLVASNLLQQAADLIGIGEYNKALDVLNEVEQLGIKDKDIRCRLCFFRGLAHHHLKRYEKAIADYTQSIALDSKSLSAYHNRGYVYGELKQYDKAIADFTQAIALGTKNADAYIYRGFAYGNLKQYDKAVADFTQAIALGTKNAYAYICRGVGYGNLKQYDKAVADFTQAIALDSENADAYLYRGVGYSNLKQYDKALADYQKVLSLQNSGPQADAARKGIEEVQSLMQK